jgi:hypothetical protein
VGMVSGTGDSCPGAGVKEDAGTAGASVDAKTDRVPMICGRDKASSIAVEEGGTGTDACATTMPDRGPGLLQRRLSGNGVLGQGAWYLDSQIQNR